MKYVNRRSHKVSANPKEYSKNLCFHCDTPETIQRQKCDIVSQAPPGFLPSIWCNFTRVNIIYLLYIKLLIKLKFPFGISPALHFSGECMSQRARHSDLEGFFYYYGESFRYRFRYDQLLYVGDGRWRAECAGKFRRQTHHSIGSCFQQKWGASGRRGRQTSSGYQSPQYNLFCEALHGAQI